MMGAINKIKPQGPHARFGRDTRGTSSVFDEEKRLLKSYSAAYMSLDMLSQDLAELCVISTATAQHVHAIGLQPLATFGAINAMAPRLSFTLGTLDDATRLAENQLLELERCVDQASRSVNRLIDTPLM
jgi:hypothetical protein